MNAKKKPVVMRALPKRNKRQDSDAELDHDEQADRIDGRPKIAAFHRFYGTRRG
jgi:hypothetical protein